MQIGGEYIENLLVKMMLKKRKLKKKHRYEKGGFLFSFVLTMFSSSSQYVL